mmetsp:Transcript_53729/g.69004  ORF Transcript_53729/g.69004 Transcript_53729/m.69004 type:complete len:96 (-) Transcript_53729:110-397(-)
MISRINPREVLHLYRDILRTCKRFHWCNEKGEPWSVILKLNARKEFEQSREERDPLLLAKMLAVGRQCLLDAQYKFDMAEMKIMKNIQDTKSRQR